MSLFGLVPPCVPMPWFVVVIPPEEEEMPFFHCQRIPVALSKIKSFGTVTYSILRWETFSPSDSLWVSKIKWLGLTLVPAFVAALQKVRKRLNYGSIPEFIKVGNEPTLFGRYSGQCSLKPLLLTIHGRISWYTNALSVNKLSVKWKHCKQCKISVICVY